MVNKRMDQQIRLQDGRTLGYAEYGAPDGVPVFYFHGFPSSRLDWLVFENEGPVTELNARIIAADRPGSGLSDFQRGRRMLDWPTDVAELADALQIDRFAVLGISGGGPYASACAFGIPGRLTKLKPRWDLHGSEHRVCSSLLGITLGWASCVAWVQPTHLARWMGQAGPFPGNPRSCGGSS